MCVYKGTQDAWCPNPSYSPGTVRNCYRKLCHPAFLRAFVLLHCDPGLGLQNAVEVTHLYCSKNMILFAKQKAHHFKTSNILTTPYKASESSRLWKDKETQ
jgi:hypothetical protein